MDKKIEGQRGIFDVESNGFLYESDRIHCIVVYDFDSGELTWFDTVLGNIREGLDFLDNFKLLIGHNIMGFDFPLIYKLYGRRLKPSPRDTYVMSKMFFPEQKKHSIEYYGKKWKRFKPPITDYSTYTPEMLHRCKEDVMINVKLYRYLINRELVKWKWLDAIKLEQEFQYQQTMQEMVGLDIDVDLAHEIIDEIDHEISVIDPILNERLPLRVINLKDVNKPFKKDGTYSKMVEDWYAASPTNVDGEKECRL